MPHGPKRTDGSQHSTLQRGSPCCNSTARCNSAARCNAGRVAIRLGTSQRSSPRCNTARHVASLCAGVSTYPPSPSRPHSWLTVCRCRRLRSLMLAGGCPFRYGARHALSGTARSLPHALTVNGAQGAAGTSAGSAIRPRAGAQRGGTPVRGTAGTYARHSASGTRLGHKAGTSAARYVARVLGVLRVLTHGTVPAPLGQRQVPPSQPYSVSTPQSARRVLTPGTLPLPCGGHGAQRCAAWRTNAALSHVVAPCCV